MGALPEDAKSSTDREAKSLSVDRGISSRGDGDIVSSPLLLTKRKWGGTIVFVVVLFLATACHAIAFLPGSKQESDKEYLQIIASCAMTTLGAYVILLREGFTKYCFHELGFRLSTVGRRCDYRYERMTSFWYGPKFDETGKLVSPLTYEIDFEIIDEPRRTFFNFVERVRNGTLELVAVREAVSRAMAVPLAEKAIAGGRVHWTSQICFEGDEVLCDVTATRESRVPLKAINMICFKGRTVELYAAGLSRPLAILETRARNFYPGLHCLKILQAHYRLAPAVTVDADGENFELVT